MTETIQSFLERVFVPPLKWVLDPLHAGLDAVPSVWWRVGVCIFLLLGTLWTLRLNKESIFRGAPSGSRRCDLRWWVLIVLVPYLFIYLVF
jgi:hypothetical protein